MSIKALKTAITIMTFLFVLGLLLLFYGLWRKSSELDSQSQTSLDLTLPLKTECDYRLHTVSDRSLIFVSDNKADCPITEIDKRKGNLVATYSYP